ncbi:MAG: hypothetical protein HY815_22435 [Candidatus Riflebacteria bacterium]|nr:hypothetical protein [Candidatus Riflebacteria bacterium]
MNDATTLALPPEIQIDTANTELTDRFRVALLHPLADTFVRSLESLAHMARGIGGRARLYMDFSPLSLGWAVFRADGSCWMAGGLIFSSATDGYGNGGAPSYSVSLSGEDGWSLRS